MKHTLCNAGW